MPKIEVARIELIWPDKFNEDGTRKEVPRANLPFQIIKTVNESRATREAKKGNLWRSLFDVYKGNDGDTFEGGWMNKLIWGDNLLIMGSLLEKFAGKIDLIYIDPPFATGADFSFTSQVGSGGETIVKEQSIIAEKAYRDTWTWISVSLPGGGAGPDLGERKSSSNASSSFWQPTGHTIQNTAMFEKAVVLNGKAI